MDELKRIKRNPNSDSGTSNSKPRSFVYHLHPPRVARSAIRFNRTFGLGGMALLLFLILALTGLLLRFAYIPTPAEAYDSILLINRDILFGRFVRNIHYWSGIFMVIVTFLHFVRTFLAQAYYDVRRVNWLLGLALLILVVFSNFTGYLLPWDQLAFWAVTVATNMLDYFPLVGKIMQDITRGGADVGPATLLNFFTFHTGVLPVLMVLVMVYHFWKVRKAKGVAFPVDSHDSKRVPANPDLLLKELVVGLILIAAIFLLSILFSAPLQDRANPAYSPNPAKAPWYFMGIQELLLHMHPFFSVILLPVLFFGSLVYLPYHHWKNPNPGQWFHSGNGRAIALQTAVLAAVFTPLIVLVDEYVFRIKDWSIGTPLYLSQGIIPFLILLGTLAAYVGYLKKVRKAGGIEIAIALFVVFIISYSVLTIVGIWFRGEGMALVWPWSL